MSDKVVIYTDGGSDPNPGIGGWAAIVRSGTREKVLSGNSAESTNNRMELTAAIEALKLLKRPCEIDLYTDSQYLRRGITEWIEGWAAKGWVRKDVNDVPNKDLWQTLWPLTKAHQISWHWVRGHSGNQFNERVDRLAREARLKITPGLDFSEDVPRLYLRSSCRGNPGPGGWGIVLEYEGSTQQFSGNVAQATNNRMEITAALEALNLVPQGTQIHLLTTSDYMFQGATRWIHGWKKRGWKKADGKDVSNAELWQALDEKSQNYKIVWVNAKGLKRDEITQAGQLASAAAKEL